MARDARRGRPTLEALEARIVLAGEFTEVSAGLPAVDLGSVSWGDSDNDGDLDALIVGKLQDNTSISRIYRNDGSGTFTDISAGLPGLIRGAAAWGDYDGDGDLDIILTGQNSMGVPTSRIYRNDGSGTFTDISAGLVGLRNSAVAWGDSDNDGDLDLLISGRDSMNVPQTYLYRNDGGTFTSFADSLPDLWIGRVAWGDYDNDGDLDILLTGRTSTSQVLSRVYRNDGENAFTDIAAGLTGLQVSAAAWGDYDNDGDLDIVLSGQESSGTYSGRVYRNDGSDTFTDISAGIPGLYAGSAAWGDYDNDGDLDILLTGKESSGTYSGRVYRNDGSGTFTDINAGLEGIYLASAVWGDHDGDGDLDILMAGRQSTGEATTRLYRNNASTANTAPTAPTNLQANVSGTSATLSWDASTDTQTASAGLSYVVTIGTTSGVVDTVAPMSDRSTGERQVAFRGLVQGTSWTIDGLTLGQMYYWSVQAVDTALAGGAFAAEQSFTPSQFSEIDPGLVGLRYSSLAWGDYDGDGDLDVLITGRNASNGHESHVYRNDGSDTFTSINAGLTGISNSSLAWGDYDNDGDLDILMSGGGSSGLRLSRVYRNDGSDTFTDISAGLLGLASSAVAWGDYDNDGDLDILLAGQASTGTRNALIYRNNGDDTFTNINAGLDGLYRAAVAWGDYDNDGDLDLLMSGRNNSFQNVAHIYRNDGSDTFTNINAGLVGAQRASVAWSDYDGDGDLDLIVSGFVSAGGATNIYRNDGSDTFTDISAGLPGFYDSSVSWGDYDNDGDLDLAILGTVSGAITSRIYRNDGSDTFTDINAPLQILRQGSLAWGDYDGDGDLDLLMTGSGNSNIRYTRLYRNDGSTANTAPTAPTNLQSVNNNNGTIAFSWDAATDSETAAGALSYVLTIGSTSGGVDVASPMADTGTGFRRIAFRGTIQGTSITFDVSDLGPGTYYWSVQAVDAALAGGTFAAEQTFLIPDVTPPEVASIVSTSPSPTGASSVEYTVTFSEAVTGVDASDFSVTATGTASGVVASVTGSGTTYTVTIGSLSGVGTIRLDLNGSGTGIADQAGNALASGYTSGTTLTIERVEPGVVLSTSAASPTNLASIPFVVIFSEEVVGFSASEIQVDHGMVVDFSGVGATYTFSVIPTADGPVTVSINAAAAADATGNPSLASNQVVIESDRTAPGPVISSPVSGPTNAASAAVTIDFGEPVIGFSLASVEVSNGSASDLSFDGRTATFRVVPEADGLVTIQLDPSGIADSAGNAAGSAQALSIWFDSTAPTASVSGLTHPRKGVEASVTIVFSEPVIGFNASGLVVSNFRIVGISGEGDTYTARLMPIGPGSVSVAVAAGAATDAGGNASIASEPVRAVVSDPNSPAQLSGDGTAKLALFVPGSATFTVVDGSGVEPSTTLGLPGDVPVPADYDGDGITDLAVYRPSNAEWFIQLSTGGAYRVAFGAAGTDQPVPADYDGDGRADIATFRPSSDLTPGAAEWFIQLSTGGAYRVAFGAAGTDQPVPADYDGDGRADIATFRPSEGLWALRTSGGGDQTIRLQLPPVRAIPNTLPIALRNDLAINDLLDSASNAATARRLARLHALVDQFLDGIGPVADDG